MLGADLKKQAYGMRGCGPPIKSVQSHTQIMARSCHIPINVIVLILRIEDKP